MARASQTLRKLPAPSAWPWTAFRTRKLQVSGYAAETRAPTDRRGAAGVEAGDLTDAGSRPQMEIELARSSTKLSNDQWTLSARNPRWSAINRAIRTSSQGWVLARSSGASPQPSRDCSDSDPWTAKDALAVPRQKRVMRIDEPMEPKRPIEPQNQPRGRVEGFRDDHSAPVVEFDRRVFWCRGRPGCTTPQPSPGVLVLLTAAPSRTRIRRCWRTAPCRAVAQLLSRATVPIPTETVILSGRLH